MDAGEDQNTGTTSGNPQTSGNSRAPQIAHMSLYERQAVQVRVCVHKLMHTLIITYKNKDFEISHKIMCVCMCCLGSASTSETAKCRSVLPAAYAAAADQQCPTAQLSCCATGN